MKKQIWRPINPDGSVNDAELRRPAETAEPATWEAPWVPGDGWDAGGDFALLDTVRACRVCPQHRFSFTTAALEKVAAWMRWAADEDNTQAWAFPENVALVSPTITTQAEADRVLPALLSVKAARREAVFAPRERIDLCVDLEATTGRFGLLTCPGCRGWGVGETGSLTPGGHPLERECKRCVGSGCGVGAVRVRGGDVPLHPAWVRALRDQAKSAGVPFSLRWGEWIPIESLRGVVPLGTPKFADYETLFYRVGADRSGCTLDGVAYPEEP